MSDPAIEARKRMIAELRKIGDAMLAGEGFGSLISPQSLGLLLQQSANEIESLGINHVTIDLKVVLDRVKQLKDDFKTLEDELKNE